MSVLESNFSPPLIGEYTDGQTAKSLTVRVEVYADTILLSDAISNECVASWNRADIDIRSHAVNQTQISPSRDADESVSLPYPPAEIFGESHAKLPIGKQAVIYFAGLVVAVLLLHSATPAISKWIAHRIPIEYEKKMSDGLAGHFLEKACVVKEVDGGIDRILNRLHAGTTPRYSYRVVVLSDKIDNAFALPGGLIVVGRGLLEKSANAEELAGVLAHEIQHVEQRHVMAGIIRASLLTGLWTLAVGDYSGLLIVDPTVAYQIASLKFSRDDETSADAGALQMIDAGQISRKGYVAFFKRIAEEHKTASSIPEMISTHPAHENRIRMIEAEPSRPSVPIMTSVEWEKVRAGCTSAK